MYPGSKWMNECSITFEGQEHLSAFTHYTPTRRGVVVLWRLRNLPPRRKMRNDRLSHVQSVSSANPSSYPNACSTHGVSQRHRDLLATRRYLKRSCIPHPASHSKMLRLLWSQHYYGLMLLVIVAAIVPSLSASPSRYSPFTADQDAVAAGRLSHFLWSGSPSRSPIPPPFLLSPFANNYYPSRLLMSPDRGTLFIFEVPNSIWNNERFKSAADFLNDDDDASFDNVPEEYSRSADGVEYLSWNGRLSHGIIWKFNLEIKCSLV